MALNSLLCADVPLSNYSLTCALVSIYINWSSYTVRNGNYQIKWWCVIFDLKLLITTYTHKKWKRKCIDCLFSWFIRHTKGTGGHS